MNTTKRKPENVAAYITAFPKDVQRILQEIRTIVQKTAPSSTESISYGMPAYKIYGKPLIYFAAFPHHIGFYATPTAQAKFSAKLAKYKQGKGSVQFPLNRPIPYELIQEMTNFKMKSIAPTITGRINDAAIAILEENPNGVRWTELIAKIKELDPSFHPKTVNGCVWKLAEKFPDTVYKPSKGVFRLVKYKFPG